MLIFKYPLLIMLVFCLSSAAHADTELEPPTPGLEWLCADWDEPTSFTKEKIVVSLGCNCAPARHFQAHKLAEAYLPFDWCFSSFTSIYTALDELFKDFLARNNLEILSSGEIYHEVYDKKYDMRFIHDFSVGQEHLVPLHDYQENKTKYERRIKRFKQLLRSRKPIFFFKTVITKEQALILRDLLCNKYPLLKLTLVVINNTDDFKQAWNEPNLKNYYISDVTNASVTQTMFDAWKTIFMDLGLLAT